MNSSSLPLKSLVAHGGRVIQNGPDAWRLEIPAGGAGPYRLAQLEDYTGRVRRDFPWQPPTSLSLRARASAEEIPGTWGFGLWNDPFVLAVGRGYDLVRLPTLPQAAWFFFASPPNYLSLRDDLPAQGALAATFRSAHLPTMLLPVAAPALPLAIFPPGARLLRRLARLFVRQDSLELAIDATQWHNYGLSWRGDKVIFQVDGKIFFQTGVVPHGPLGLVMWVDNQYAALPPDGRFRSGKLPTPPDTWIEIAGLQIDQGGSF